MIEKKVKKFNPKIKIVSCDFSSFLFNSQFFFIKY